jgi:hypothetical protein
MSGTAGELHFSVATCDPQPYSSKKFFACILQ